MSLDKEVFLIVEDEPVTLQLIQVFLESGRGGEIHVASSVEDAKGLLADHGGVVTTIICDHDLGDKTGIELLFDIRSGQMTNVRRDVAFIMLTAHGEEQIIKNALALDVHAYLMKPVSQKQMLHCIDKATTRAITLKSEQDYTRIFAET